MPSMRLKAPVVHARLIGHLAELPGQLVEKGAHTAHLSHLVDLGLEILEVEPLARLELLRQPLGFVAIDLALRVFDQGQHIAHAEDARGHAVGMKRLEPGEFLADADELDRLAGDMTNRKRRAAAGVAVELGENEAGQRQRVGESARRC